MNFRHLLEQHQLARQLFKTINRWLAEAGVMMTQGTLVDATIIEAPSSTKNKEQQRDPEMHQTKKGNQWHFGMKAHIGVDAKSGLTHSLVTTAANEHDLNQLGNLLHGEEQFVSADAGYQGAPQREELAEVDVTALEIDPKRASRITENLDRLGLKAKVAVADAGEPKKWWDGRPFERILLDAPCTASGIVRRHPDIPWSRKPEDIGKLARTQGKLLETMWPLLANNGRILYAVCSVFPEEGPRGIEGFCARHPDAKLIPIGPKGEKLLSLAPAESLQDSDSVWPATHDGFFYALLEKI